MKNLKIFNYDPSLGIPADTARRDYMEYFVEKVLRHTGDSKKPTSMSFHVKWLNCGLTEALAGTGIRTAGGKGEMAVERC